VFDDQAYRAGQASKSNLRFSTITRQSRGGRRSIVAVRSDL
jgi:hypothetical protein